MQPKPPDAPPSLDVVFDHVKKQVEAQDAQVGALDTKAGFVLGSASLLTAGLASFQDAALAALGKLGSVGSQGAAWRWALCTIVFATLALYIAIAWAAYCAYKTQRYSAVTELRNLRNKYLGVAEHESKKALLDTMIRATEENQKVVAEKARWTRLALLLLFIQACLLAALVLGQVVIRSML